MARKKKKRGIGKKGTGKKNTEETDTKRQKDSFVWDGSKGFEVVEDPEYKFEEFLEKVDVKRLKAFYRSEGDEYSDEQFKKSWEAETKKNIRTVDELEKYVFLTPEEKAALTKIEEKHPIKITPYYVGLVNEAEKKDPLWRLAIPTLEELSIQGSYDTSGERENVERTHITGVQHKYGPTVLILATRTCAMYCRHCFRKRLVGLSDEEINQQLDEAAKYVELHKEVTNVLITGGDPLTLSDYTLDRFLKKLSNIKHLEFIRIGTRVPVTFPYRINSDPNLIKILRENSEKKQIHIVTHFNHPDELKYPSRDAVRKLVKAGIPVQNQAVLLRKVNDNPKAIAGVMKKLVSIGANPYYVFQCRPVRRAKHFQVTIPRGYEIIEEAKKSLSGPAKRFNFIMSHFSGKIEISSVNDKKITFKYHQARNPEDLGKVFCRKTKDTAVWLDKKLKLIT